MELKKLDQYPANFPELPPRISAFGIKTSMAYRAPKLEKYLKDALKLPYIEQSY